MVKVFKQDFNSNDLSYFLKEYDNFKKEKNNNKKKNSEKRKVVEVSR